MAVVYKELNGWPKQRQTRDGFFATRKVLCTWANLTDVENYFMSRAVDSGLGEIYPYKPDTGARAFDVSSEPLPQSLMGEAANLATYGDAVVTVQYRTPRAQDPKLLETGSSVIASQHFESASENIILSKDDFQWRTGGINKNIEAEEAPTKTLHSIVYVLTIYNRPYVPIAALGMVGSVNEFPVDALLLSIGDGDVVQFPAETLLLTSVNHETSVPSGSGLSGLTGSVTYRMDFRLDTWNQWWRPGAGADGEGIFQPMYRVGHVAPYKNYPLADFADL